MLTKPRPLTTQASVGVSKHLYVFSNTIKVCFCICNIKTFLKAQVKDHADSIYHLFIAAVGSLSDWKHVRKSHLEIVLQGE